MARKKSSFDFAHTCPKINKAIDACKENIQHALAPIIQSICEHISDEKAVELAKKYAEDIYTDIEDCFESVRETNEDMRAEANRQINTT